MTECDACRGDGTITPYSGDPITCPKCDGKGGWGGTCSGCGTKVEPTLGYDGEPAHYCPLCSYRVLKGAVVRARKKLEELGIDPGDDPIRCVRCGRAFSVVDDGVACWPCARGAVE